MRQKTRRVISFISLLLFPVTMNYLSPYVCIDGAMSGIVAGSILVFGVMFLSGLVFGRAWCAWVCPMAGLSDVCLTINPKTPPVKTLRIIRYCIFAVWLTILVACFVLAGGIKGVNPLHLSENVVSVDEPLKYITYYMVVLLFFILTLSIGKRGACHTVCWMAPFLTAGYMLGKRIRLRQVRIGADASKCVGCRACEKVCPMSIPVVSTLKEGQILSSECILCCACADACPEKVLKPTFKRVRRAGRKRGYTSETAGIPARKHLDQ